MVVEGLNLALMWINLVYLCPLPARERIEMRILQRETRDVRKSFWQSLRDLFVHGIVPND